MYENPHPGGFRSSLVMLGLASLAANGAHSSTATPEAAHKTPVSQSSSAPMPGYVLKFQDEFSTFNGSAAGTSGWMTEFPTETSKDPEEGRTHNVPLEAQYYSDSSVGTNPFAIVNGTLQISATRSRTTGRNVLGLPYNSGIITSFKSFHMQYGYIEVSAKMPRGVGLWPAIWLLPVSQIWPPEIDVLEQVGSPTTIYQTLHFASGRGGAEKGNSVAVVDTTAAFHTYAVDWEPNTITFYFDGRPTATWPTPSDMKQPMFILVNLAVGGPGSWPGQPDSSTAFPANMYIDYVRAYASPNSINIGGSLAQ